MVSTPNILSHAIDEIIFIIFVDKYQSCNYKRINVTKIWRRYKLSGQIRVKPICVQINNKKKVINNNIKIR